MKKAFIIVVLILAIVMSMFTGCAEKEPGPLRVCVDLQLGGMLRDIATDFYDVVEVLHSNEKIGEYEVEYIPGDGPERASALDRIRTEVMSGGGPDVFIVNCVREDGRDILAEALFPMPEKTMEAGFFLPLDEYIENAEYGEWENFNQAVLDAGRNEEGQQIVPLVYTLPAAVYLAEDVQFTPTKETTWEDMLADEELYSLTARLADGLHRYYSEMGSTGGMYLDANLNYVLGDLADFKEDELLFTEEELQQRVREVVEMKKYAEENDLYNTENWYEDYLGAKFDECAFGTKNGIGTNDEITILPICSDDGGVTATITAYGAVNRNTRNAEEAFKVIDRLFYFGMMDSWMYNNYFYVYGDQGTAIPMNGQIFCERYDRGTGPNGIKYNNTLYLEPQKQEAFFNVLDGITHVEFADALHTKLEEMMFLALQADSDEEREEIVHRYYETLKQMIAE